MSLILIRRNNSNKKKWQWKHYQEIMETLERRVNDDDE